MRSSPRTLSGRLPVSASLCSPGAAPSLSGEMGSGSLCFHLLLFWLSWVSGGRRGLLQLCLTGSAAQPGSDPALEVGLSPTRPSGSPTWDFIRFFRCEHAPLAPHLPNSLSLLSCRSADLAMWPFVGAGCGSSGSCAPLATVCTAGVPVRARSAPLQGQADLCQRPGGCGWPPVQLAAFFLLILLALAGPVVAQLQMASPSIPCS